MLSRQFSISYQVQDFRTLSPLIENYLTSIEITIHKLKERVYHIYKCEHRMKNEINLFNPFVGYDMVRE